MDKMIQGSQEAMVLMEPDYWRVLVATSNGQPAGVLKFKFHDSKFPPGVEAAHVNHIGCWPTCRLGLLVFSSVENYKCKRDECFIEAVVCEAQFRGQGIGKKLMNAVEVQARNRGCTRMGLYVAADNRAKNLYERQGYEVTATNNSCCQYLSVGVKTFYKMEKQLEV